MARNKQHLVTRIYYPRRRQDQRPFDLGDLAGGLPGVIQAAWPVGSLFFSTVATDPAVLLGFGTWALYAQGRVLVGQDPTQAEFDVLGETGGEKTHLLTCAETPSC